MKMPWWGWLIILLGSAAGHISMDGTAGMVIFPALEGADALIDEVRDGRSSTQPTLPVGE